MVCPDQPEAEKMVSHRWWPPMPNMDKLAAMGCSGLFKTIPDKLYPGSEVANLAVLGYDVEAVFEGRCNWSRQHGHSAWYGRSGPFGVIWFCIEGLKIKTIRRDIFQPKNRTSWLLIWTNIREKRKYPLYTGVSYRHLLDYQRRQQSREMHPHTMFRVRSGKPLLPIASTPIAENTAALLRQLTHDLQKLL